MDEQGRTVVVCDNGSQFLKYGLAEDYSPIYKLPTVVGRPKNQDTVAEAVDGLEESELLVSEAALKMNSVLDISRPIHNGIVTDWDDMTRLWENAFSYEKLKINPQKAKICMTESPANKLENRQKMIEIMFETFAFHSVFIGNQAALTLFGRGLTSGVVVEFHEDVTDISPVHLYPLKLAKRVPSTENQHLSEIIFDIVEAADAKIQTELFKRIILLDESSVDARNVEEEIRTLYLERVLQNDADRLKHFKIRVDVFPTDNDNAFTGGALLARINKDIPEFWMSRSDYQENGFNVLNRK